MGPRERTFGHPTVSISRVESRGVDLALIRGFHGSSFWTDWTRIAGVPMSDRVPPPARNALRSRGPQGIEEEVRPVWCFFWAGERKRLGLPPLLRKEDEEEELFRRWIEK